MEYDVLYVKLITAFTLYIVVFQQCHPFTSLSVWYLLITVVS